MPDPWPSDYGPPPSAIPEHIRGLVRSGDIEYALEVTLFATLDRGEEALEPYQRAGRPATAEEGERRFLLAAQAAGEELDRLALTVAEG
jgi:hypothetical protein